MVDVDLCHLHDAARAAATAVDRDDRAAALRAVTAAYTGDLAADHDWAWLTVARETCRRTVIDAYTALAADAPSPQRALELLQAAVRVDPFNTDLTHRVSDLLHQLGDPDAARQVLDSHTKRLTAAGLPPTTAPPPPAPHH